MSIPFETWKPLDKRFLISNMGRVFDTRDSFFIRPSIHKSKGNYYLRICLASKRYMLHVLVATHFHECPSPNHVVDHKDDNTLNPAADNLAWITKSENIQKAWYTKKFMYGNTLYYGKVKKQITKKRVHK